MLCAGIESVIRSTDSTVCGEIGPGSQPHETRLTLVRRRGNRLLRLLEVADPSRQWPSAN
jgi:hypothetical protein